MPNAPLYYSLAALSSVIKARQPSTNVFLSGLVNLGYNVRHTCLAHVCKQVAVCALPCSWHPVWYCPTAPRAPVQPA